MKSYNERAEATREKIKIYKSKARARRKAILLSAISLCSCLLIVLNLLFLPSVNFQSGNTTPNLSGNVEPDENNKDDYSAVIEKLNAIINGEGSDDSFGDGSSGGGHGDSAPGGTGSGGEQYVETTDNQVAGVTEGDLIKRTDKYIYYLAVQYHYDPLTLRVYPIDGLETKCIAEFTITSQEDNHYYGWNNEMYLSEDGSTVTLVLGMRHEWWEGTKYYSERYTEVVNIDVTDHSNIKITERYCVSGRYVSSRLVDGELLLVTNFSVPYYVDFSDEKQFIPSTGAEGEMSCIPAKDIHCPEKPVYARFTVVCSVNVQTLEETGSKAFLSSSEDVYVSANNIYLANSYTNCSNLLSDKSDGLRGNDYHYVYEAKTEVSRVEYGGKLEYKGSFTVEGGVLNRFCMDEKYGVLRVVISPNRREYTREDNHYSQLFTYGASLYCIDIETYKTVGKLENFAPEEDRVQSARFDGDKVYVCTAVRMIDPVFAIDISDYNNIHFVDTGKIPGYSIFLRKFYGNTLLGIGYGEANGWRDNLKIELYKETENSVESAAAFTYADDGYWNNDTVYDYVSVYFSTEYKAYFIDAERGLIGLGLTIEAYNRNSYNSSLVTSTRYILLQYDGENLNLLLDVDLGRKTDFYFYNTTRAVYADGAFYVFTEDGFTVMELNI